MCSGSSVSSGRDALYTQLRAHQCRCCDKSIIIHRLKFRCSRSKCHSLSPRSFSISRPELQLKSAVSSSLSRISHSVSRAWPQANGKKKCMSTGPRTLYKIEIEWWRHFAAASSCTWVETFFLRWRCLQHWCLPRQGMVFRDIRAYFEKCKHS